MVYKNTDHNLSTSALLILLVNKVKKELKVDKFVAAKGRLDCNKTVFFDVPDDEWTLDIGSLLIGTDDNCLNNYLRLLKKEYVDLTTFQKQQRKAGYEKSYTFIKRYRAIETCYDLNLRLMMGFHVYTMDELSMKKMYWLFVDKDDPHLWFLMSDSYDKQSSFTMYSAYIPNIGVGDTEVTSHVLWNHDVRLSHHSLQHVYFFDVLKTHIQHIQWLNSSLDKHMEALKKMFDNDLKTEILVHLVTQIGHIRLESAEEIYYFHERVMKNPYYQTLITHNEFTLLDIKHFLMNLRQAMHSGGFFGIEEVLTDDEIQIERAFKKKWKKGSMGNIIGSDKDFVGVINTMISGGL